jgi:hypothetical protein
MPLGAQISWGPRVAVQGVRALVVVYRANKEKNRYFFKFLNENDEEKIVREYQILFEFIF